MGSAISVDDFGVGFSNLALLTRFRFDEVKLDRSLIQGLDARGGQLDASASICRAVGQMGRELGMRVLAEGVESPAQASTAEALGCSQAQGYLFGRPMPAGEFETRWLLPRTEAVKAFESVTARTAGTAEAGSPARWHPRGCPRRTPRRGTDGAVRRPQNSISPLHHRLLQRAATYPQRFRRFTMIRHLIATLLAVFALNAFAAVDVNQATRADLETVKGIGPGLSGKILEARKSGNFKNWEDMVDRVGGIGARNAGKLSQGGLTVAGSGFDASTMTPKPAKESRQKASKAAPADGTDPKAPNPVKADKVAKVAKPRAAKTVN